MAMDDTVRKIYGQILGQLQSSKMSKLYFCGKFQSSIYIFLRWMYMDIRQLCLEIGLETSFSRSCRKLIKKKDNTPKIIIFNCRVSNIPMIWSLHPYERYPPFPHTHCIHIPHHTNMSRKFHHSLDPVDCGVSLWLHPHTKNINIHTHFLRFFV